VMASGRVPAAPPSICWSASCGAARRILKSDEIATYEHLMQRLREQRDAAEAALDRLPPRPELDVATLLDGELSVGTWPKLPVARQHFLLGLAVHHVRAFSTDMRLDDRAVVVWHGEKPPAPTA
jgi:hypothetical protein